MLPLRTVFFASHPDFALPLDLTVNVLLANGSEHRLHTCMRLDQSHGTLLTPAEAAASAILLKADLYLQRLDLSLKLLYPMMVAACFSFNVEPQSGMPTPASRYELWSTVRPDISNFITHPGATVTYTRSGRTEYVGIYVRPNSSTSHIVFDLELMSLSAVDDPHATVSSLTDEVYRSSPLTSSLFGYPAHTYASAIDAAACVGYGIGLLPRSWSMSRKFNLPMLQAPPRHPAPSIDAFVDGGVTHLSQRDPQNAGSLPHATLYRGDGASSLPIPVRGPSSAAFASAPGN
jgi:hypothetical protein